MIKIKINLFLNILELITDKIISMYNMGNKLDHFFQIKILLKVDKLCVQNIIINISKIIRIIIKLFLIQKSSYLGEL